MLDTAYQGPWRGHPNVLCFRSQLPLVADDSPRTWVQLAYEGTWHGHPMGDVDFTRDVFEEAVANFDQQANAVPLTYEHPDYRGDGMPVPAAGWIHELEIRDGDVAELWGLIEFTKRAASMIRDGEYKHVSVVLGFESIDRRTGKECGAELFEVGLVNAPFLDGMQPIALSTRGRRVGQRKAFAMNDAELIKEGIKALGDKLTLPMLTKWIEAKKILDAVTSEDAAALEGEPADAPPASAPPAKASRTPVKASALPVTPPAPAAPAAPTETPATVALADELPPADTAATSALGDAMKAIAEMSGMDEASLIALLQERAQEIADHLAAMASGEPSGTAADGDASMMSRKLRVQEGTIGSLKRRVEELEAAKCAREKADAEAAEARRVDEARADVHAALEAHKIRDVEVDDWMKIRLSDHETFDKLMGERDPVVPKGPAAKTRPPTASVASDEELRKHPAFDLFWQGFSRSNVSDEKKMAAIRDAITEAEQRA